MGGSKRGRGHAATSSTGSRLLRCAGCGVEMEPSELHIRHVVARSEGGTGEPSNLQLLCPNCSLLKTAQALSSVSNFGAFVAEAWAKAFRLAPKITTGLSALAAVAGALLAVVLGDWNNKNLASPPAATFSQQLKVLDQTQASLQNLSQFVARQRSELEAGQRTVEQLQQQRKSLEPLVTADQRVVNALLRVQEERAQKAAAHERLIGFGLGVLASIVASILFAAAGMFLKQFALRRR